MSNWNFLNEHRCRLAIPAVVPPQYVTTDSDGFNGMFRFALDSHMVRCVVSDGMGWQHVSVSYEYEKKTPSWSVMCKIKELFWEDEDCVVQFHPPKSVYVNCHPYCLHLWRCTEPNVVTPIPHPLMVGPRGVPQVKPFGT